MAPRGRRSGFNPIKFVETGIRHPVNALAENSGKTLTSGELFLVRILLWLAAYVLMFFIWGLRNAWPLELWSSVFLLPASLVFALQHCRGNEFGLRVRRSIHSWDFMIACLLMAIGIASGILLLMAFGWVSLGAVILRPEAEDFDWVEWFKLPLVFFVTIPVWVDLAGSRHDWLAMLATPAEIEAGKEWVFVRLHVVLLASLYLLGSLLRGGLFWRSLVVLPLLFWVSPAVTHYAAGGDVWDLPAMVAAWGFVPLSVMVLAFGLRWLRGNAPRRSAGVITEMIRRTQGQSHSLYLIGVVVGLQQYSLVEGWLAGSESPGIILCQFAWLGAMLLLRLRSTVWEVDLRSRVALALSLFVLLAAEWTDVNALRHASLGLLMVGAFSWRRVWSWLIYLAALVAWGSLQPGFRIMLQETGVSLETAEYVAYMLFLFNWLFLLLACFQKPHPVRKLRESPQGWLPAMRFALILLLLFAAFQTLASFWPDVFDQNTNWRIEPEDMVLDAHLIRSPGFKRIERWHSLEDNPPIDLYLAWPGDRPCELNAPERILKNLGWEIQDRKLIGHPLGQAVELRIERDHEKGSVIYWWLHRTQAFANYLRGRRILWSGWHLAHRDFRLIILVSGNPYSTAEIKDFAASQNWFHPYRYLKSNMN